MTSLLKKLFGDPNAQELKKIQPLIDTINALELKLEKFSGQELKEQFKKHFFDVRTMSNLETQKSFLNERLPEVFAYVREVSKRTLGLRHFDVQLAGGIVLHQGKIAEMRTGEGKTLVATLPLVLNALAGRGAHLVTPNDYLAKVGAHSNGPLYTFLDLSVGVIGQQEQSWRYSPEATENRKQKTENDLKSDIPNSNSDWPNLVPCTRGEAYACDITYGTNNEFGFDYLRDNMAVQPDRLTQRELIFAIVDEVDSILIDEARTPLIISAAAEESADLYAKFAQIIPKLAINTDYLVNEKERYVTMTDSGIHKVESALGVKNLYADTTVHLVHHLEEALKAQALFQRDRDYVVKNGEVIIVDEFTGRLMPGRRYSEGLHQAIEAKEKVKVRQESKTMATITFQNLFRMYGKLAGMTGTAATEAEEFAKIYNLDVVEIPTHRPMIRLDHDDVIYKTESAKFTAIVEEIKRHAQKQQPVLVGTISIEKSERLSKLLKRAGIKHDVLNAKQHEREAKIVEHAGEPGRVTVATNMAGRGVDILLGGKKPGLGASKQDITAWEACHQEVLSAGGLAVIGTERHEARRIDNQLRGRSGRQGDPGESQFYVSLDDDLMRIFAGDRLKSMMNRLGLPDNEPIRHKLITSSIEQAQRRVEGHNFDIRKHLVEYDDVINQQREVIYRKRRRILLMNVETDRRLHEEVLELLHPDEIEDFKQKIISVDEAQFYSLERLIYLRTIDALWVDHLSTMQHLREGIGLKGYAQRDPLVEYKDAAFGLFTKLKDEIENQVVEMLMKLEVRTAESSQSQATPRVTMKLEHRDATSLSTRPTSPTAPPKNKVAIIVRGPGASVSTVVPKPINTPNPYGKVGRNNPCPCGSGKKFKKCHGA
ncbi:preprotein translocase subunit SecA [Candidatus Berkelbacteria bacterium]|nr:preprotein translocase subunit SecA [Candidatus Berkelbacteria bacterium]